MARKGITYDQVANAAAALQARGNEPTIQAVRMELGDTGGYSTISQHLNKWRTETADKVDAKALPREVEDKMMEALISVWNVANKAANQDLAAIKQEHADERAELKAELKTAQDEILSLEEELDKTEDRAQQAENHAKNLQNKLVATKAELEATKELYKALIDSLKPQADQEQKAADTKQGHQPKKEGEPGNKQAGTQQQNH